MADPIIDAFDPHRLPRTWVVIDLDAARLREITAVAALDKVVTRLRHHGATVRVHGMDRHSRGLMWRVRREGVWAEDGVSGR